jgi:hypothetical protein
MSPARLQHKHKNNGIKTNESKEGRKLAIIDVEATLTGMILGKRDLLSGCQDIISPTFISNWPRNLDLARGR